MVYKVCLHSWEKPNLVTTIQIVWVNIDIPSDDPELKEKIIFGLQYNRINIIFNYDDEKYGKCKVHEIIPFSEYPGYDIVGSELIDLNNSLEAYATTSEIKININTYTDIIKHLTAARSGLLTHCDTKTVKHIMPVFHMLSNALLTLRKLFEKFNYKHYRLIQKRNSESLEIYIKNGIKNGTLTQTEDGGYKNRYGDKYEKDSDGLWKQTSFGM